MPQSIDLLSGVTSPLTRLNYFDGLFLRAELLRQEQRGARNLVFQSNMADGPGVCFGLDADVEGDTVSVQPGLAIDPLGRVVLLVDEARAQLSELLARPPLPPGAEGSSEFAHCFEEPAAAAGGPVESVSLYAIVLRHTEALCGWEEVRGRACEDACDAAMDRPYVVDSAHIALRPVGVPAKLPRSHAVVLGDKHLRSRIASAMFADELARAGSLISGAGLRSATWRRGAQPMAELFGEDVPLALVALRGSSALFVDPWIVRRERMEPPPRRYWAGRMRMRPWDVFVAQVLQFQAQLTEVLELLAAGGPATPLGPWDETKSLLHEALAALDMVETTPPPAAPAPAAGEGNGEVSGEAARITTLKERLRKAVLGAGAVGRLLVDAGIVELPSAGWLAVDPSSSVPVDQQVAHLLGPGVDLRFIGVRADQAAAEFEAAQHLDRISLLQGIDDPARRERVDVFVPDADVTPGVAPMLFKADVTLTTPDQERSAVEGDAPRARRDMSSTSRPLDGVARLRAEAAGRFELHAALAGGVARTQSAAATIRWLDAVLRGDRANKRPPFGPMPISDAALAQVANQVRAARAAQPERDSIGLTGAGDEVQPLVAWLSLTADKNPFTLPEGADGLFEIDFVAYTPLARGLFTSVQVRGRYEVLEVIGPKAVEVRLTGGIERGGEPGPPTMNRRLRLDLGDGRLTASPRPPVTAVLAGTPPTASADVALPDLLFGMDAVGTHDNDLRNPDTSERVRAMNVLTILEGVRSPGFVEHAAHALFGEEGGGGSVTTASDWVLFRRRTTREAVSAPPPVVERRVDVWMRSLSPNEAGGVVDASIMGPNPTEWLRMGTAVFAGETADLRTPSAQLQAQWQSLGGGNRVLFGVYARAGTAAQPAAVDRVRAVIGALRPTATMPPSGTVQVLDNPAPPEFLQPGSDGAIALIAGNAEPVVALCADLFHVINDEEIWKLVRSGAFPPQGVSAQGQATKADTGEVRIDPLDWIDFSVIEVVVWHVSSVSADEATDFVTQAVRTGLPSGREWPSPAELVGTEFEGKCPVRVFLRSFDVVE